MRRWGILGVRGMTNDMASSCEFGKDAEGEKLGYPTESWGRVYS